MLNPHQAAIGGDGTKYIGTSLQSNVDYEYIVINSTAVIASMVDDQDENALLYLGWTGISIAAGLPIRAMKGRAIKSIQLTSGNAVGICRTFK